MTPPLMRRLASMLYEALLLFGVLFISGWLFDTLTQSRHALMLRHGRQFLLFAVLGAYFVFFWHRSGQTLAMKTWRIRLVTREGSQVTWTRAGLRYLLAWMWFLPALSLDYTLGLKGWASIDALVIGAILWALTIRLDKNRQFLHDRLAGTRLITVGEPSTTPTIPSARTPSSD